MPSAVGKRRTDDSSSETTLVSDTHYKSNLANVKQSVNSVGQFSITTFTGHTSVGWFDSGLSGAADFVWMKELGAAGHHAIWHTSMTNRDGVLLMNTTGDQNASGVDGNWGGSSGDGNPNVAHGESGNKIGTGTWSDTGGDVSTYVCYCWRAVAGVSAFGSYEGTDGAKTVTGLGFTPRMLIIKDIDAAHSWFVYDSFRGSGTSGSSDGKTVTIDNPATEETGSSGITFNSDGWTMNTTNGNFNDVETYIYMAWA